ncbi:Serine-rich coiled-coil domain-containing protein 2 [Triplophysa tibetana]|uniref:Serine-rich coiled-coil domain-containing protein 2 n=1 Tax=Triplophysa tibetana TaxID=1572043 RepID=A0A5A9PUR5_9TELE|nr:Serine-rich coiled-coil domain-containing protein 2 [Triplophysa tibetana]
MERNSLKQLSMVSRLPKFACRPPATTITSLPQGSALPVSPLGCKSAPLGGKNSVTSLKWRKCEEGNKFQHTESLEEASLPACPQPVVMAIKKPSSSPVKCKTVVPTPQSSATKSVPQANKTYHQRNTPKCLSTRHSLYNGTATLNGMTGVKGLYGSCSSGSGLGHSSQPRTLENPLSLSNDCLKSAAKENIVRSQSFTHFKRATSPAHPPMTRSFSLNKATELANELPRPLAQSPVARPPLIPPNPVLTREKSSKFGFIRPPGSTSGGSKPMVTMKKSLLPSFSRNKPSSLSYRFTRPSLAKYCGTVGARADQNEEEVSEKNKDSGNCFDQTSKVESAKTTMDKTLYEAEIENLLGPSLDVLEDMSFSSSSSLEHNDTSEEYMDDFDNLGNGGETLLLSVHKEGLDVPGLRDDDNVLISEGSEDSSAASLHSFLSETVDWAGMGLTAGKDDFASKILSPVGDFPLGSSLDLSPSVSSGGTYMWDEEGMEALGGSGHPCGSFDSDLNSIDILNDLENVESCDLEEDDLMLDLDLSENASLQSDTDGLSLHECSGTGGFSNQRRRRQQLWSRHDQFCIESSGILESIDGLESSDHVTLDDLTLNHMALECSSVKVQLLQLNTLLQIKEDGSIEEILEAQTPDSTDQSLLEEKVTLLLKEVQELKNELRNKEKMITELTQQMSSPVECNCRQESAVHSGSELQDKSNQTPWTRNPQILQAPRFIPNRLHTNGRLSSPASTNAHCDNVDAQSGHRPLTPQFCSSDLQSPVSVESVPVCTVPMVIIPSNSTTAFSFSTLQNSDPDELNLMGSYLKISKSATPSDLSNPSCRLDKGSQKHPLARSSFLTVPPPNYIKRAATPIKPQEVQRVSMTTGALGRLGNAAPSRTRHQLAHKLPCINPASRPPTHPTPAALIYTPQNQEFIQSQSHKDAEISLARPRASLQPNHSRLPKPKTQ